MRLICIDSGSQWTDREGNPIEAGTELVVGNYYTSIRTKEMADGLCHELAEIPPQHGYVNIYHSTLFARISSIDETELIQQREAVGV